MFTEEAIEVTREYYLTDERPWAVGYSGGKDSALVVKILLSALSKVANKHTRPISIFYCDTGVEIPVLKGYIEKSLRRIRNEAKTLGIPITVRKVRPPITDTYFVKVVGRGYPPPTNKFRWCTDKLRILPIQKAIQSQTKSNEVTVLLGTRHDESEERRRILRNNSTPEDLLFTQSGYPNTQLFCPIVNFSTEQVWEALLNIDEIRSIDLNEISNIYKQVSGECPIIRLPDKNPCSKGRFGCWTCTVIRQDKASQNLIANGHTSLLPLLEFREWLLKVRDDPEFRCTVRRNGVKGPGPFRLSARQKILRRLRVAEKRSGHQLISDQEIKHIHSLWRQDRKSESYRED